MTSGVVGTKGFVAWFYILVYSRIVKACKNIYVRIIVHSLGLIVTISGLFAFIATMPSLTSALGLFLLLIGLVVFVIPFGVNAEV